MMKLYWQIPLGLKAHFEAELLLADVEFGKQNYQLSWRYLERAHILGQAWPFEHTKAHWKMMRFAFKLKNTREIIGQIPRLLVGGVKSFVGEIPVGNTGGADVPPLRHMEIPEDLQLLIDKYK